MLNIGSEIAVFEIKSRLFMIENLVKGIKYP